MPRYPRPWLASVALTAAVFTLLALRPLTDSASPATPPGSAGFQPAANHSPVLSPPPAPEEPTAVAPSALRPPRSTPLLPATTALLDWSTRYLASAPASAATHSPLLAEGLALARERRTALATLIRTDPEAALAAAFPRALRAQLPAAITAELEQPVSARAELAVIQTCLHPPGVAHDPADDLYRSTVIDGREYRVHVYGSRLTDASLPATSLHGIALDGHLAVSESRHRILEPGEALPATVIVTAGAALASPVAPASATSLAVEADGVVTLLPSPDALPAFAATLLATEQNPVINEADAGGGSSTVSGRPTQAWTHGAKTLLVIRVDFSDLPGTPINKYDGNAQITPAYIDHVINGPEGVRAFVQANSYGKSDLLLDPALDVTAVLRLPATAHDYALAGDNALLHSDARAAATTAGFDVAGYDRVAVVFSYLGNIVPPDPEDETIRSKITYGGLGNLIGANLWINAAFDLRVVGHELGHNYGLRHANLWTPTGGSPVSLAGDDPATKDEDERSLEYGDPFDLMGGGDFFENDFSHWNKSLLQWIPDAAVTVATSSGTYRVHRFDAPSADLGAPRALKIVRDTTRDYWIGYRRGLASAATDNGAYVLWGYNANQQGNLLDLTTPGTNPLDAPLALLTTFHDSAAGISLRPVAQGGSGPDEWLDIEVALQPRLAWTATSYVVNERGGSATLTVTRTANPTGNVSVAYATAPDPAPGANPATATTDYAHTTGTLVWLDGDTTPRTITIPLVADALVEGTETFTVTLSAPVGGVIVDPATTTVTLADPGARDPAFAADFINSTVNRVLVQPDGTLLVAGWFSSLQDSDFNSYSYGRVARLTSNGDFDPAFDPGSGADSTIYALARQPDGKILVGGAFTSFNGTALNRIARLHPDGALDGSFTPGAAASDTVYDILVQPDGRILVAGAFTSFDGVARNRLVRLLADGSIDPGFTNPTYTTFAGSSVRSLALQADGKVLAVGLFYYNNLGPGGFRSGVTRLLADGTRDTAFDVGNGAYSGPVTNLTTVERVALLSDGRIIVGGAFSNFGPSTMPESMPERRRLARLNSNGTTDISYAVFPTSIAGTVRAIVPLPDQSVLIGGDFGTVVGNPSLERVGRVLPDGVLDTAFAAVGGHASTVQDLALQPDGNVVLAGDFASFQGASPARPLWRLVPGLAGLPGVIQFSADAHSAVEGAPASLSVARVGGSTGALTIGYATVAASATAGADFTPTTGTLTWADGDVSAKTITVPTTLDASADTPETFIVNLGAPLLGGALLGDRQQATVTLSAAFSAWAAGHFNAAELADPAISGDSADPDGDGLNNLAEFALARDPRAPDAAAMPTAIQNIGGVDYLTITFRRRAPALDLAYAVQTSGDLAGAWTPDAIPVGSATAHGDGTETVTYRDTVATSAAGRRFLRVHVTRTP